MVKWTDVVTAAALIWEIHSLDSGSIKSGFFLNMDQPLGGSGLIDLISACLKEKALYVWKQLLKSRDLEVELKLLQKSCL